jgi:hypothetical protein
MNTLKIVAGLSEAAADLQGNSAVMKKVQKALAKGGLPEDVLRRAEKEAAARAARRSAAGKSKELADKLAQAEALAKLTDPARPLNGLSLDEYLVRAKRLYEDLLQLAGGDARDLADKLVQPIWLEIAGRIRPYDELREATVFVNAVMAGAHPNAFRAGARLDVHHIIEAHTFEQFRETLEALGYASPARMPAIVLEYEFHIRSPRKLLRLAPDAPIVAKSLTRELLEKVAAKKFPDLEEALKQYRDFYRKPANIEIEGRKASLTLWPYLEPFFDDPKTGIIAQLGRLRDKQKLVSGAKAKGAAGL